MKAAEPFAAEITPDLAETDELLQLFGRWAMNRIVRRRCGSAEGNYRSNATDEDRVPREVLLLNEDAMRVQRALADVPEKLRVILELLYVPKRHIMGHLVRPEMMLRLMRITPRLARERHAEGLREFRYIHARLLPKPKQVAILPPPGTTSAIDVGPMAGESVGESKESTW